jgi:Tfp pilus assembly protein PilZ
MPEDPRVEERRRRPPATLRLDYPDDASFVSEFRENLRRKGTFVPSPRPLGMGRRCIFEIHAPGLTEPLRLSGEVVWSSKGTSPDQLQPGQQPGMGIRYDQMDDSGFNQISVALEKLGG